MPLDVSFTLWDEELAELGYTPEMIEAISDTERAAIETMIEALVDIDATSVLEEALKLIGVSKEDLTEDVVRARIFVEKTKNDQRMF